ncbi:multicomponent Na+:H+ antiporter subunit D [Halalkaliarchaeum desulfuricum]|uniref:Multicomponent Na+:H+ antiporter subunit D n=1 Tax=Halalkaliarchaeum desulfuricum TaxID=2055893 RepID=A0A343TIT0_9EURY|nr:Na(+)/H(+) antiporter subunit D [Halalkaliarchaeum desulfuricum]AUX09002.1 multicomponent Na+:H+ antiporter subunit D [Halalkaliarchaeum desulfuricum]
MNELLATIPPFLPVAVAALLAVLLPRHAGHAVGMLAALFVLGQSLVMPATTPATVQFLGFETVPIFVDQFTRLYGVVIGFLAAAAVAYSWGSDAPRVQTGFALAYVSSTLGMVFAGDWLTLIFFWELMAVTSTLLVWHYGGEAVRAGYRYAIAHGIGGTLLLGAVTLHYARVGSFLFEASTGIAGSLGTLPSVEALPALLAALGIGVNCAFIGLHTWLPDTYPRPHVAASVFLSVFTTKTAVYAMYRAFPEGGLWLAYLGGAMAVYGVFFALLQYDPRRLLSYHIQAQVGYMLAGIGLASLGGDLGNFAVAGGVAHAFNNVLYKSLLFMAVGVVIYRTGINDIRKLGGLWKVMPVTFVVYVIGAASITAVPGFTGFISKGMVIDAAHEVSNVPLLLGEDLLWWLLIIGGVGTFMSFIKLGWYIFFHNAPEIRPKDSTVGQTVGMVAVAGLCVYFGIFYGSLFELLPFAETWETSPYSTGHLIEGFALLVAGFVGFFTLKGPLARISHLPDMERVINPAVFYTGRGFVWGVTELWAAVDRVVMQTAATLKQIGTHPEQAVRRVAGISEDADVYLRADIGRSVIFLTLLTAAALAALLL